MNKTRLRWLRFLQYFFYIVFVALWFKDNFPPLRKIPVSYLVGLIPWLTLTLVRVLPKLRSRKSGLSPKILSDVLVLAVLLLLAVVVRLPYLAAPAGMMTSDDAIPALMGKHISEGKVPPVCFYGQLYMGAISSHVFALAFKIFSYSMLVLKCTTLLFYLTFIAVQFLLLREIFSRTFAVAVAFFYSLPIPPLVAVSLDNTSAFGLVLLLGSLLLYLSYLISKRDRGDLVPALGFLMGLAFWTNQITMAFILTSLLIVAGHLKLKIGRYAVLAASALVGLLPQLLAELFNRFPLAIFLASGQKQVAWGEVKSAAGFTASLFASNSHPARYFFVLLLALGLVVVIVRSLREKSFRPQGYFAVLTVIYYPIYFFSSFSNIPVVRYFYPLYVCLPVLLLAPFVLFRPRFLRLLPAAFVLFLFFAFNFSESRALAGQNRGRQERIDRVLTAMEKTGLRYWTAEYWTAYLLTAVSKEKLIVDSYTFEKYPAYRLAYWNQNREDSFVFLFRRDAEEKARYAGFLKWLEMMDIQPQHKNVDGCELVYGLPVRFYPKVEFKEPPSQVPQLALSEVEPWDGYLRLTFINNAVGEAADFLLIAEIPGFSTEKRVFSLADNEARITLPYPRRKAFPIKYSVAYMGVLIPSSVRELGYALPEEALVDRKAEVVDLRGIGPEVAYLGKNYKICEQEAAFELNPGPQGSFTLHLSLVSPFEFSSWHWYGDYSQGVRIELDGKLIAEKELTDGENILEFRISQQNLVPGPREVRLKFRYQMRFTILPLWLISAFLEKIEIR